MGRCRVLAVHERVLLRRALLRMIRACATKLSAEAKLTRAETDIFTRRLLGQTLSQIAAARRTKPSTVKTQYATLGRKLQAIHINPRLGYWALREVIGDRYDED